MSNGQVGGQTQQTGRMARLVALAPQIGAWIAGGAVLLVGLFIVGALVKGMYGRNPIVRELASVDFARGVITFIFALGTIGIALILTMGALLGNQSDERLTKAKEVLTVLIGVFGTILGFYFGTSKNEEHKPSIGPPMLEMAADQKSLTLLAFISGGETPYVYSITFDQDGLPDLASRTSTDGWIRETIDVTMLGAEGSKFEISATDARKRSADYESNEKELIRGTSSP